MSGRLSNNNEHLNPHTVSLVAPGTDGSKGVRTLESVVMTRGSPEAAGDLTRVSGAKLRLSRHVTEGGAVQEPYTVMADTGGGRGACEEKAGRTKPIRQWSQRVWRENKRKRSRL